MSDDRIPPTSAEQTTDHTGSCAVIRKPQSMGYSAGLLLPAVDRALDHWQAILERVHHTGSPSALDYAAAREARAQVTQAIAVTVVEALDGDEMNTLHQVVCRVWDSPLWEIRWDAWLAWWKENQQNWLGPRRGFGVWMRERLAEDTVAAVAEAVAAERAEIRNRAHDRMFPFRMSGNWAQNSSETIADVLLGTYIPTERGESA